MISTMKMTNSYHNGFYLLDSKSIKKKLLAIKSNNPSKVSTKDNYIYYNAEIFLHGICHVFAYALNKKFGYDILEIKSRTGSMVHWCCIANCDNEKTYIDVRGTTSNFEEFIEEFKPEIGENPIQTIIKDLSDYSDEWEEEQVDFANEIISKYNSYYLIK